MADDKYINIPKGGGGGGGIVGPNPSTQYGVAIYAGIDGAELLDSVLADQGLLVSAGRGRDFGVPIVSGDLGISFAGSAPDEQPPYTVRPLYAPGLTGWIVNPNSAATVDYLSLFLSGTCLYQAHRQNDGIPTVVLLNDAVIRPDTGSSGCTIGKPNVSFFQGCFTYVYFGGYSTGYNIGRDGVLVSSYRNAGATTRACLGYDSSTGSEWYFNSIDATVGNYRDNIHFVYDDRTTKISAPADSVADANHAIDFLIKGADKAAGTGDGGNVYLGTSTSVGGAQGNVCMPTTSGPPPTPATASGFAPFQFDAGTNTLYIHNGIAWKSVVLT